MCRASRCGSGTCVDGAGASRRSNAGIEFEFEFEFEFDLERDADLELDLDLELELELELGVSCPPWGLPVDLCWFPPPFPTWASWLNRKDS